MTLADYNCCVFLMALEDRVWQDQSWRHKWVQMRLPIDHSKMNEITNGIAHLLTDHERSPSRG
jgi:hypothetical protein